MPRDLRFDCRHCPKTFGRLEHRKRHELTHTKGRQIPCDQCQKSFIRTDALRRHQLTHATDSAKSAAANPRACLNCAEAKIKCSRHDTCRRCAIRKLDCRYPSGNMPRDRKTSTDAFRAFHLTSAPKIEDECAVTDSSPTASTFDSLSQPLITPIDERIIEYDSSHSQPLITPLDDKPMVYPEISLQLHRPSLSYSAAQEGPSPSDSNLLANAWSRKDHLADVNSFIPQTLQSIERWPVISALANISAPPHRGPIRPRPSMSAAFQPGHTPDIDLHFGQALVDDYLANVNVLNPIFDADELRAFAQVILVNGFSWDSRSCLLLLILANGAISMPYQSGSIAPRPVDERLAQELFYAAQERMGIAFLDSSLVQAQIHYLSGVFYMSMLCPFDAWKSYHAAVACCQSFNCVQAMGQSRNPTPSRLGAEHRVYWSSWKAESELRWELGLRDFDTRAICYPEVSPSLPADDCEEWDIQSWYFYLSEISLWRLHFTAEQELHRLAAERISNRLVRLANHFDDYECQVTTFQQSLAPSVRLPQLDGPEMPQLDSLILFKLGGQVGNYWELTTWPFVDAVVNHEEVQPDCVRKLATRGLHWHFARLRIYSQAPKVRNQGTWLVQRRATRSALVLLAAALAPMARELLPSEDWQSSVQTTIQMLTYWADKVSDAAYWARILSELQTRASDDSTLSRQEDT